MKFEHGPPDESAAGIQADGASACAPAFDPPEEWEDALERQCTSALIKRAKRFAAYRARFLGHAVSSARVYAEDLVAQILSDTADGVLRWNHQKRTLLEHVLDHVRQRARREALRGSRHPHHSIDVSDPAATSTVMAEVEASLHAEAAVATPETAARAEEVIAALLELAGNDLRTVTNPNDEDPASECVRYLGAVAGGATTKEEIMELGRLTERGYRSARRRVSDLIAQLPLYLQPLAHTSEKGGAS